MNQELYIKNALKEFNVTDSAIAELEAKYSELKINGIDDKQGYAIVRAARLDIKTRRIEVDKKRKELNEVALNHQRQVNAEAKRITALLSPIEDYLEAQEKEFEAEKERIKKEKERLEQEKVNQRVKKLLDIGFIFDGLFYRADYTYPGIGCLDFDIPIAAISIQQLKEAGDDKFDKEYAYFCAKNVEKKDYLAEEKRKQEEIQAKLEAERLETQKKEAEECRLENERLENIRREQEAERNRLESIALEQAKKEAALKAEQKRIEIEKQALLVEQETIQGIDSPLVTAQEVRGIFKEIQKEDSKPVEIDTLENKLIEFYIEISGQFKYSKKLIAKDKKEAKKLALNDLHNRENLNFEQNEIEIY